MPGKKRTVILFGAGAAIPWGGPSTRSLTELIKDSAPAFLCNDGQTKIVDFVFNSLTASGYKSEEINFETIINVIEEFIAHYAYFDENRKLPTINKSFFCSRFENNLSNFSIVVGAEKHGYQLEIPKGTEYPFAKLALSNQSPVQFYFQHLLSVLLTSINSQISKYSYHTNGKSVIDSKSFLNQNFKKWYRSISEDSLVRMYTLNYDRLFKILAEQAGTSVFEGFECGEFIPHDHVSPDIRRILSDFDSPIYYNLHGSAFWQVHPRDEHSQLKSLRISLRPYPVLEMNNSESPVMQIDRGKNIVVSNIITGYQKTQKSFITPFKQMQAAFDKDCFLADELLIIGYSFGDYHINASIVSALRHNHALKLNFIDPAYCEKDGMRGYDLLVDKLINIFPDVFSLERTQPIYSENKNTCTYF